MRSPVHIQGLSQFPDLQQQYRREWRQAGGCSSGCNDAALASKFMRLAAQRRCLLVAHVKTRR